MLNATPEHQAAIREAATAGVTPAVAGQPSALDPQQPGLSTPSAGQPGPSAPQQAAPPIGQGQPASGAGPPSPEQPQGQPPAGQPQVHPDPVPYERFSQVNEERNQYASANQVLQQQLALYQANQGQAAPSLGQQQQQADQDDLAQIAQKLSELGPDEGLYGKEAIELVNAVNSRIQRVQAQAERASFYAQNPDFHQVVGTEQQIAPPLAHMINQFPQIYNTIMQSHDPYQAALTFGRMGLQQMQQTPQTSQAPQAPQAYPGQPAQVPAMPGLPQPALPIAGAPGPQNMTGYMAGVAPPSISNFNTGTGVNPQTQMAMMTDAELVAWRSANRLGGG